MKSFEKYGFVGVVCGVVFTMLALTGCESTRSAGGRFEALATNSVGSEVLRVGDPLTIIFSDTPNPELKQPFEERVKDDGQITLIYNKSFVAAGKTRGDLEKEIRRTYVPDYFLNLTVTIKAQARFYFVDGQVRNPSSQEYKGEMTVLKAIASAGGFTDFANRKKVRLTHNGKSEIVNCKKALENSRFDLPVYPGDKVFVPRRLF